MRYRPFSLPLALGAVLLVVSHPLYGLSALQHSGTPTVSASSPDSKVMWMPPHRSLELCATTLAGPGREQDVGDIRPAWGMLAAAAGLFLYLLLKHLHGDTAMTITEPLR
ncbi:MAG: hypothetical protein KDA57_21550 [Planctomycetales bacterium]|nr:hypothetical protein [Planctomycetales bacterium]